MGDDIDDLSDEIVDETDPAVDPSLKSPQVFESIKIDDTTWEVKIQDEGSSDIASLPNTSYLGSKVTPIGPEDESLYYYSLTAISVDLAKNIRKE